MHAAFLLKAQESLKAANILLADGLNSSTVNRAYFAMFHAARAALYWAAPNDARRIKTHASVIGIFGLRIVHRGYLASRFGSWINDAEELRLAVDYDPDHVTDHALASDVFERARAFVAAVEALVADINPDMPVDLRPAPTPMK